jgi:hypothetical protein
MSVLSGLGGIAARKELLVKVGTHSKDVIAATSRLERAARLMANVDRVTVASL